MTTGWTPVWARLFCGNPLDNIQLVADPAKTFFVIMKDGRVVKNTLPR